ncbi:MAG: ABC transporter ATP-binding protein [Phycisphaerae bacterium]
MKNIVSVNDICHRYGDHIALDGVRFQVRSGECFGLLGPNGSGKTTLFRILTTLLTPSGGTAEVCGADVVRDRAAVRTHIGIVFQSPSLDIHLTAWENLLHGGHLYGLSGAALKERINRALGLLNVGDRAGSLVKTLSGGLRRRVELAKCLLHDPALLILDEPSTGLDPLARRELWQYLQQLREERGLSILLTTHFLDEAERCDRLAVFDRGRRVACDTPAALKRRVGGECITIDCEDPPDLCRRIATEIGGNPTVLNGALRIETEHGLRFATEVMTRFGGEVKTVTMGKPTLEDVFVHETGHRFDDAEPEIET